MNGILTGILATLGVLFLLRLGMRLAWRRRWRHGRGGRGFLLARLFRRLEATAEQERILTEGLDRLRDEMRILREGLFASRGELAAAVAAERLEPAALDDLWARQLERLSSARQAFAAALGRLHASLDPRQRALLAETIRRAGTRHGCGRTGASMGPA